MLTRGAFEPHATLDLRTDYVRSPKAEATVYLLTIRHHRELSFDFARLWPSAPLWAGLSATALVVKP